MKYIERAINSVSLLLAILGALATCTLMFAICGDVAVRLLTGGSMPGLVELSQTALVVMVFFGLAYAEAQSAHISTSILNDRVPLKVATINRIVVYLISTVFIAWMAYATLLRSVDSYSNGEYQMGLTNWPLWPSRFAISLGLVLLTIRVFLRLLSYIGTLRNPVALHESTFTTTSI